MLKNIKILSNDKAHKICQEEGFGFVIMIEEH